MSEILFAFSGLFAGASGEQIWAALWPSVVAAFGLFSIVVWLIPAAWSIRKL